MYMLGTLWRQYPYLTIYNPKSYNFKAHIPIPSILNPAQVEPGDGAGSKRRREEAGAAEYAPVRQP